MKPACRRRRPPSRASSSIAARALPYQGPLHDGGSSRSADARAFLRIRRRKPLQAERRGRPLDDLRQGRFFEADKRRRRGLDRHRRGDRRSPRDESDLARWRSGLEARFDVDGFLRWLALNTMVGNGDAYGGLAHNYYLYGSPRHRDRLFWIPWDPGARPCATAGVAPAAEGGPGWWRSWRRLFLAAEVIRAEVRIRRSICFTIAIAIRLAADSVLMDDAVYRAAYRKHVEDLLATVFEPSRVGANIKAEHARIAPYVVGAEGEDPPSWFRRVAAAIRRHGVRRDRARCQLFKGRAAAVRPGIGECAMRAAPNRQPSRCCAPRRRCAGVVIDGCALCWLPQPGRSKSSQSNLHRRSKRKEAPRKFEVAPRGYIQLDWRGYPGWTVAPGTGRLEYGTFEVRRLRAGVDGRWRRDRHSSHARPAGY